MAPPELNMFARLFPASPPTTPTHPPAPRKFIKIRIVTWNMAEQRPKGDLSELFDFLPSDTSTQPCSSDLQSLPSFPADAKHPYHLVVVGGQECPSSSNIPRAIGAGFKLLDKDKDSNKDKSKPDKDSRKPLPEDSAPDHVTGWTLMLEDWLCNGGGTPPLNSTPSSSVPELTPQRSKSKNSRAKAANGMYQLLVKERLMGIYLSIFVHKNVKTLVKGTSKDSVTAGLIGGRLGNKGGVGISLNLKCARILFLNCHLAAHEGKVHHRLANLEKIKSELQVDDFLAPDDYRKSLPDITARFDYTFLFGDLNFRLDISRLHADWLISRQEYQKALAFDQLSNIMKNGAAFQGFTEAPIDFAPTFKYDVLKMKRSKSKKQQPPTPITTETPETPLEPFNDDVASLRSSIASRLESNESEEETDAASPPTSIWNENKVKAKLLGIARRKAHRISLPDPRTIRAAPSSPSAPDISDSSLRPPPLLFSSSTSQKSSFESETDPEEGRGVYDSSAKQRVPSWCDRILTKSNVQPEQEEHEASTHRGMSRVGNFLSAALRFPARNTRDSLSSPAKPAAAEQSRPRTDSSPRDGLDHVSRFLLTNPVTSEPDGIQPIPNSQAQPLTSPLSYNGHALRRSFSASSHSIGTPKRDQRRASTSAANATRGALSPGLNAKWRFLPTFFHHASPPMPPDPSPKPVVQPRRGEVVCLSYDTLSDRSMRNLEARSDHRPLIGSYAIYI